MDKINGNILRVAFTTSNGARGFAEVDATTHNLIYERILEWGESPPDEHNTPAALDLDDGSLLTVMTQHGVSATASGGIGSTGNHTYYTAKSPTGRIEDFSDVTTIPNTIGQSNYVFLEQSPTTNDVWCFTNDDAAVSWLPLVSSDRGVTWSQLRGFFQQSSAPGGGQNQLYAFPRRISGDTVRIVSIPHPSNGQNAIRLWGFDLATKVLSSGSGTIQDLDTGAGALPEHTAGSAIYTPASGKSARLLDVSDDGAMLALCLFDTGTGANGEYGVLVWDGVGDPYLDTSWDYSTVVATGAFLYTSNSFYPGGMVFRREPHSGIGVLFSRESAGTWTIGKKTAATAGDLAAAAETVVTSGTSKLIRPNSPIGATAGLNVVYATGSYTDYTDFSTVLRWAA